MQLVAILQTVAEQHGLPAETVQLLPCATHESVQDLITARGLVDVVIPRGGAGLINAVVMGATVPTIETGTGNCHVYIDRDADLGQAITILLNSKTRRCSVCNAAETVLIDTHLSDENKLSIITALQDAGVTSADGNSSGEASPALASRSRRGPFVSQPELSRRFISCCRTMRHPVSVMPPR